MSNPSTVTLLDPVVATFINIALLALTRSKLIAAVIDASCNAAVTTKCCR